MPHPAHHPLSFKDYTLTGLLQHAAGSSTKGVSFVDGADDEHSLSYAELYRTATCTLGALRRLGVQQGHELIIQTDDNRRFLVVFWACLLGKIIPVPVSTGNREDHRLKLIKIWEALHNPWLAADEANLARLEKYAADHGADWFSEATAGRTLTLGALLQEHEPAVLSS
ncbi:AMP-binding protein [Roseivirga sp. BDSF3-8]|uniref:AMP-binding protein n=1 Tax=Roseivirga sp. BDSF3-8 TaxID=3241598 RepID=UPI0035321B39